MNRSEHVEIKKHGSTYKDISFCPECGCGETTVIESGLWQEDDSFLVFFNRYGDGKKYRCNECGCEYVVCVLDRAELVKAKGFARVLCVCAGIIFSVLCVIFSAFLTLAIYDGKGFTSYIFYGACLIASILACGLFFYLCRD